MEFHEKLQALRKRKGLTQEELASHLFVSRAAVSKWESGRGYPNIDSLKAIAKFYAVTIDELLSGEEALTIAEDDHRQKQSHFRNRVFGLLDCSTAMLFFLPFFGQSEAGVIRAVSLLSLTAAAPYLRSAYLITVLGIIGCGILTLILRTQFKATFSLLISTVGVFLFIISRQPYAAVFLLIFQTIKVLMLIKKQ